MRSRSKFARPYICRLSMSGGWSCPTAWWSGDGCEHALGLCCRFHALLPGTTGLGRSPVAERGMQAPFVVRPDPVLDVAPGTGSVRRPCSTPSWPTTSKRSSTPQQPGRRRTPRLHSLTTHANAPTRRHDKLSPTGPTKAGITASSFSRCQQTMTQPRVRKASWMSSRISQRMRRRRTSRADASRRTRRGRSPASRFRGRAGPTGAVVLPSAPGGPASGCARSVQVGLVG